MGKSKTITIVAAPTGDRTIPMSVSVTPKVAAKHNVKPYQEVSQEKARQMQRESVAEVKGGAK